MIDELNIKVHFLVFVILTINEWILRERVLAKSASKRGKNGWFDMC